MPELSRFLGMVVRMYWADHPPPHIHVDYQGREAIVKIDTLEIVRGELPRRAHSLLIECALLHRSELSANWRSAESGEPMSPIAPLE